MVLAQGLRDLGCGFLTEPQSNQIFPILPNKVIAALQEKFAFYHWQNINEQDSVVRLVTFCSTDFENVNEFLRVTTELLR